MTTRYLVTIKELPNGAGSMTADGDTCESYTKIVDNLELPELVALIHKRKRGPKRKAEAKT